MTDWAKLKVVDLKVELKKRDLSQNGLKAELVARLEEADRSQEEPMVEDSDANGKDAEPIEPVADAEQNGDAPVPVVADEEPQVEAQDAPVPETVERADEKPLEHGRTPERQVTVSEPVAGLAPQPGSKKEVDEMAVDPVPEPIAQPDSVAEAVSEAQPEPPQLEEKLPLPTPDSKNESDEMAVDPPADLQKRKRRSVSPPPDEDIVAKRARLAEDPPTVNDAAPAAHMAEDTPPSRAGEDEKMEDVQGTPVAVPIQPPTPQTTKQDDYEDFGRSVAPALHLPTPALYVSNLMRPLRPADIQAHLVDLATPRGETLNNDVITLFHLDQIRTHAFVVFTSTAAASRVRALLHDTVWPDERNRKALWLDFIPPEKVQDWVGIENGGGGRSGARWEVVYVDAADGGIEARLEATTGALSRAGPPPPSAPTGPRADGINSIPVGPRGQQRQQQQPPTGPRPKPSGPGPRPAFGGKWTTASPSISYTTASEDVVQNRLDSMHAHYTDRRGPYGREINRYSFEEGDVFVDRGKEVFEGIRPPHRERGGRGGRRGGFGGGGRGRRGGSGWPRSGDRYMPAPSSTFRYDDRR